MGLGGGGVGAAGGGVGVAVVVFAGGAAGVGYELRVAGGADAPDVCADERGVYSGSTTLVDGAPH